LKFGRSANDYAIDLVRQIVDLNNGKYIEDGLLDAEPMDICIGVAGYPEKHFEAPNLNIDVKYTKEKIAAGASYIVTQMFFSNKFFYDYVNICRNAGINVPIIPGLKIITSKAQVKSLPKNFYIDIPNELAEEIENAKPEHVVEIGVEWAFKQVEDLLNNNVPAIHFYVMQNSSPIKALMNKIKI
ncbi:MAG: methylenetetrahydrofolate reductase, partial [Melioribacteraceae bacterium]|nr:methylenetetrahydrofolate reductase [Melioribacteraceae bacterium]